MEPKEPCTDLIQILFYNFISKGLVISNIHCTSVFINNSEKSFLFNYI